MRKLITMLCSIMLAFSFISSTAAETAQSGFTDTNGHWSESYVDWVYEQGIMKGVSETQFAPDRAMSRAMAVTVLYQMSRETASSDTTTFTDVQKNSYYATAVSWATQNGIVRGVSSTRFAPGSNVSRQDFAVMLHRYSQYVQTGLPVPPTGQAEEDPYTIWWTAKRNYDYMPKPYATDALGWAVQNQIITGISSQFGLVICPFSEITRAQAAVMLVRYAEPSPITEPTKLYDLQLDQVGILRIFGIYEDTSDRELIESFLCNVNQFEYIDILPICSDLDYPNTGRTGEYHWDFRVRPQDAAWFNEGRVYDKGIAIGNFFYVAADQDWMQSFIQAVQKKPSDSQLSGE